jgi:Ca-activated chloride channel family protein
MSVSFGAEVVMMLRKANLILLAAGIVSACVFGVGARESRAAGSVAFEVAADTPSVQIKEGQRVIVRALVRPDGAAEKRRVPLAVALVLDKSGSMGGDDKMKNAKAGALEALKKLDARDMAALIAYDMEAYVAVPPRAASDRGTFSRALSRISPSGSTALYDGVRLGAERVLPFEGDYVPRVILLSDGMANVGPSSAGELAALGRSLSKRGTTITTIGLGLDYDEDLMTALAAESGGNAYFARHAGELAGIFARDMEDAVTLTARKVRVTLECGDGLKPVRAVGRTAENFSGGSSIEVAIDNLYGAEKYALFEIEIADAKALDPATPLFEAATVKLEYLDPVTDSVVAREESLRLAFAKDGEEVENNRRADITEQTEIARNAEIREEVIRLADEGRAAEAAQTLQKRVGVLQEMAYSMPAAAPRIGADAAEFESIAEELELRPDGLSVETRKRARNQAYVQKNQQSTVSEDKAAK